MPNLTQITANINGLIPNNEYIYQFYGHSNWPVTVNPVSGSFYATDDFQPINASVYFCPTKTSCSDHQGFIECSDSSCGIGDSQFAVLGLSYYATSSPATKYSSNFVTVENSGYHLPKSTLSIISSGTIDDDTFKEYDKVELSANIENLVKNETYYYEFRNLDNNYSSVITPGSGYFTANDKTQKIYTGLSLANTNTVQSITKAGNEYFNRIDMLIKPTGDNTSYISNTIKINFVINNPSIVLSVNDDIPVSQEYKSIKSDISGIIPGQQYVYNFNSVGSNWPTTISAKSGTFVSNVDHATLDSLVNFCPNMFVCSGSNNLLSWNNTSSGYDTELFTNINLAIYPSNDTDNITYSNILNFQPMPKIPKAQISTDPSGTKNTEQTIDIVFADLKSHKLYSYNLYSIEANWPFAVSHISGNFYTDSSSYTLSMLGSFCENSGICPKNSHGVLDFEAVTPIKLSWYKPQLTMRLSFIDVDFPELTYYSNIANILCADCVPTNKNVNISINSIPDC